MYLRCSFRYCGQRLNYFLSLTVNYIECVHSRLDGIHLVCELIHLVGLNKTLKNNKVVGWGADNCALHGLVAALDRNC